MNNVKLNYLINLLALAVAWTVAIGAGYISLFLYKPYPITVEVLLRIVGVFSLVISWVSMNWFIGQKKEKADSLLLAIGYLTSLLIFYAFGKLGAYKLVGAYSFLYLMYVYAHRYIDYIQRFMHSRGWIAISYAMLAVAVIMPLTIGNFINTESGFDRVYLEQATKGLPDNTIKITFSKNDLVEVSHLARPEKDDLFYQDFKPFVLKKNKDSIELFTTVGPDLTTYCYFLKDKAEFSSCLDELAGVAGNSIYKKYAYLKNNPTTNDVIQERFVEAVDKAIATDGESLEGVSFLKLMFVRGNLLHHYSYIYSGMQEPGLQAFFNQYGLGPISIANAIKSFSGATSIDSIYITISIVNFLVAFGCVVLFRKNAFILFFCAMSILTVYLTSNIIAPFLYYIRFLPVVILGALYAKNINIFSEKRIGRNLAISFIFLLIAIYNKEYGLLVFAALVCAFLLTKEAACIKFAGIMSIGFIAIYSLVPQESSATSSLLTVLAGVGINPRLSIVSLIWFAMLAYLFWIVNRLYGKKKWDVQIIFWTSLLLLFSVKVAWAGSANHIGGLLLIYAMVMTGLNNNSGGGDTSLKITWLSIAAAGMLALTIPSVSYLKYFDQTQGVSYLKTNWSNKFKFSDYLVRKDEAFKKYASVTSYSLLSTQDDFLQMVNQVHQTGKYHNYSTQINFPTDALKIVGDIKKRDFILVDNNILNLDNVDFLKLKLYNKDKILNDYIKGYIVEIQKFNYLLSNLDLKEVVSRDEFFTLYRIR